MLLINMIKEQMDDLNNKYLFKSKSFDLYKSKKPSIIIKGLVIKQLSETQIK